MNDELQLEGAWEPASELTESDVSTRKAAKQIAETLAYSVGISMKGLRYRFVLVYYPEDRPEDVGIQSNPEPSDESWPKFFETMARRLMGHKHWPTA